MGRIKNLTTDPDEADLKFMEAHGMSSPCIDTDCEQTVYLLMENSKPIRAYTDKALAFYECWVCTRGTETDENPSDYYITELVLDTSPM